MPLHRIERLPEDLSAPVMVAAFDGWVDAASAASTTAEHLAAGGDAVAAFDADVLYDYRSRRPVLDIVDGTLQRLVWPSLELRHARYGDRDLLILHGAEPDFRWRELGDEVVTLALRLGVVAWVSLGAIPAAVPHTRPVTVLASSSSDGLLHQDEVQGPQGLLRVPSACLSAVELSVSGAGIPCVGFYAQVPHYIGGPFAAATVALLQHLGRHLGTDLPMGGFVDESEAQRRRLDAAVEADDDVREILERLQQAADVEDLPSGEDLAAEIERFLRTEGGTGPGSGGPRPSN